MDSNKNTLKNTQKISIHEGGFEKATSLFNFIYDKIDFTKKQNITILYRPGENTEITFSEVE